MLDGYKSSYSLSDYYIHLQKLASESLSQQNSENINMTEIATSFQSNNEIASKIKINSNKTKSNNIETINILPNTSEGNCYTNNSTIIKEEILTSINNKKDYDPISFFIVLAAFYSLPRYGRIPKTLKSKITGKHNNKSHDNVRKKLYISCMFSIDKFIRNECKKYDITLHVANITPLLGKNLDDNYNFFAKKLIDIYFESKPKRKTDHNLDFNKKQIKKVLIKEKKDKNIKIKILNILFFMSFKQIFEMFLYDINFIILSNNAGKIIKVYLNGFETYKNIFLDEYDEEEKTKFKINAKDFLNGKITQRKKRGDNL